MGCSATLCSEVVATMMYTGKSVDKLVQRFEAACLRQVRWRTSLVRVCAAEFDLLEVAETSRDLFQEAVRGDKDLLRRVFEGPGLQRFHRFRNAMDSVEITDMNVSDP